VEYLENAWYLAAYEREIPADQPFARTLLERPVVFYRDSHDVIVALHDVRPHRFASLHRGEVVGDLIECAYHGLQFDRTGACVLNPHGNGRIPVTARVHAYPITRQYERVWIWMGDPARADEEKLPDLSYLESPRMRTLDGLMCIKAPYELPLDNLVDLSHTQFIHKEFLASDYMRVRQDVVDEGDGVRVSLWMPSSSVPPNYRGLLTDPDAPMDHWIDTRWFAPATVTIDFGITPPGAAREDGYWSIGLHIVTPETATSSHYFYANSRSFRLNDPEVDQQRKRFQDVAFGEQDRPIIENCFQNMGTGDIFALDPVLLSSDAGAIRMRRRLRKMIDEERAVNPSSAGVFKD
jgi:phenylpropionate dioxygenase-like ring-hydroxylating dioxygenase large terminal subunit